jgi:hypothetical protein
MFELPAQKALASGLLHPLLEIGAGPAEFLAGGQVGTGLGEQLLGAVGITPRVG